MNERIKLECHNTMKNIPPNIKVCSLTVDNQDYENHKTKAIFRFIHVPSKVKRTST